MNGADFLLRELRSALAFSTTRDLPPVAAYRASLDGSRRALNAVREASSTPPATHHHHDATTGHHEGGRGSGGGSGSPGGSGSSSHHSPGGGHSPGGNSSPHSPHSPGGGGGGRALKGIWKGTVNFIKGLLVDPFLDPLLPPVLGDPAAEAARRGETSAPEVGRVHVECSCDP